MNPIRQELSEIPVCNLLAFILIIIFIMYNTSFLKTLPCGKGILNSFYSNFVHLDKIHIFSNISALYFLSRLEKKVGSFIFLYIISGLLVVNTFFTVMLNKVFPKIPCSIGFSGILFGLLGWELLIFKTIDPLFILTALIISVQDSKVSTIGHATGLVSGMAIAFAQLKIYKIDL
jgi:membrane associated rhomboid family serine protease